MRTALRGSVCVGLAWVLAACGGSPTSGSLTGVDGASSSGGASSGGGGEGGGDDGGGGAPDGTVSDGAGADQTSPDAPPGADSGDDGSAADTGGGGDGLAPEAGDAGASDTGGGDSAGDAAGSDAGDAAGCVPVSCYGGAAGTSGVGVCRAGAQSCVGATLGACTGEVDPTPEACNGLDDNCNGSVDEGLGTLSCGIGACAATAPACVAGKPGTCTAGTPVAEVCGNGIDDNCNGAIDEGCACVHVAPTGNDGTGTGSSAAPFLTIQHAINVAGASGLPSIVCVASGAAAPSSATYTEAVTMRDGIDVYGGYQATGASWPRVATCVTHIADTTGTGVAFGVGVTSPTVLDGFTIQATSAATNAAITVTGSTGAIISNDVVTGGGGTTSIGIEVVASGATAATPLIELDGVTGGAGTALAIGIRSNGSAPVIQNNCSTFDASGRCTVICASGVQNFVRARAPGAAAGTESYGIRLTSSPGALVQKSSVCAAAATTDVAGIRVTGDATGTVIRENNVLGQTGANNAVGIWTDPCAGAAPWLFDNALISGNSPTAGSRADGVRAVGDCHPVVDSNVRIVGGIESANNDANGVYCARDAQSGVASRCTVLGNTLIQGSNGGYPPRSTGVRCEDGACARIENNASITGQSGVLSYGIVLGATGTFVNANHVEAGCGTTQGIGILTNNSFARIQNNEIGGSLCTAAGVSTTLGLAVLERLAAGSSEVDLHSNDLFGRGAAGACTSYALGFDVPAGGSPPAAGLGLVRNNILHPGLCNTRGDLAELNAAAEARVVQNNDFWFQSAGDVLFRDENTTNLTTIAGITALADLTASGNISADPLFSGANANHLTAASPCVDTGTAAGAPATDIDGQVRPRGAGYDIGSDEL